MPYFCCPDLSATDEFCFCGADPVQAMPGCQKNPVYACVGRDNGYSGGQCDRCAKVELNVGAVSWVDGGPAEITTDQICDWGAAGACVDVLPKGTAAPSPDLVGGYPIEPRTLANQQCSAYGCNPWPTDDEYMGCVAADRAWEYCFNCAAGGMFQGVGPRCWFDAGPGGVGCPPTTANENCP
jgi:hypothetical protein